MPSRHAPGATHRAYSPATDRGQTNPLHVNSPTSATSAVDSGPADVRWFHEHVLVHDRSLRTHVRGSFPSIGDVDDVVQESYLRVWRARAKEPIQSVKAFLFTVARHIALDLVRKERASPIIGILNGTALSSADEAPGIVEVLDHAERVEMVKDALMRLPLRCREVVILYKLQGMSRSEVASSLRISEKTADEQVARGVKRLEAYGRAQPRKGMK